MLIRKLLSRATAVLRMKKKPEQLDNKPILEYNLGSNVRVFGTLDKVNPHLVYIGDNSVVGTQSAILTHCPIKGPQKVIIEKNVWIGFGVLVLPGVVIGECSIIGAGSIVTKSFPPRSLIVGNPARKLRDLTDKESESLVYKLGNSMPIGKDELNI